MNYLGIDIGTSGLRARLMDAQGTPICVAEQAYPTAHPHPGWSEHDPENWTAAPDAAIAQLRSTHLEFSDVADIGVVGHMHGAVLLDTEAQVLRPSILWNDTRSHAQAHALDAMPEFHELSGNIVFPGFTAPKLEWVREYEPQIFARTAWVLLPAGFMNHHLTGDFVADMSDSAGTSWLEVDARDWSAELLHASHMRPDQMPRLVEDSAAARVLCADLVDRWGLRGDVTIAGDAGDNAAAACGLGLLEEGQGFVSLGTSGVLLLASYRPAPQKALHTFCHAVPDRWYQMAVMLSAADCLTWLASVTSSIPLALTTALGMDIRAPKPVRFYPYLSGERTPHNDAGIRAGFAGLGADTTREDMTRAVLEGVCFGLRDGLEALRGWDRRHTAVLR